MIGETGAILDGADAVEAEYRRRSGDDFILFLRGLTIPSASGPQLFDSCIAPFQMEAFRLLEPSLRAIRDGAMPPRRRFWVERTKKAAKDSDLAVCILWLVAFSVRPTLVQVSAANEQQAAIIKRRASDLMHYNQWLTDLVSIQNRRIKSVNGMCEVVIEATGSSGAKQGDTPDLLILNELVHVDKWGVNETHMNNADGVPRGVVVISTNAGIRGTKAELWRKNAFRDKDRWTVLVHEKVAPWIGRADVEDARRRDPVGSEFARLWGGRWISGRGDAVSDEKIDRCFRMPGPSEFPELGWVYVAGLDLGVSHDHSGVVVVGVSPRENRMKVVWIRAWEPSVANDRGMLEVDADAVEVECRRLWRHYHVQWFGYDPAAGGSFMAQRLRRMGMPMREMTFSSPKNCTQMATSFVVLIKDEKLECYEDPDGRLRRDFGKFDIEVRVPSGYKLKAVSDEYGHADVGTALVICLPRAMAMLGGYGGLGSDEDLMAGLEDDLSKDEVEGLPDGLRDIYDSVEAGDEDDDEAEWVSKTRTAGAPSDDNALSRMLGDD